MSSNFSWPRIFFYGDSLTQLAFSVEGCWGSIISDAFQRHADIIGRGFSGYNTRMCRALLPYLRNDMRDVSVATVLLGTNDSNYHDPALIQYVPVKEYKNNLKDIIHQFQNSGVKKSFVITPPARDLKKFHLHRLSEGKVSHYQEDVPDHLMEYIEACTDLAKEENIPCVDLYHAMLSQNDWKEMLIDGVHFSHKGSIFAASQILPVLKNCLEGIKEGSTYLFPEYSEVDNKNPDKSFKEWLKKWNDGGNEDVV